MSFNLKEMSINELSEFIGFNPSKIRYYESELSLPIERDSRGRRKYTENTIKLFLKIKALVKEGKKLEEVKTLLNQEIISFTLSSSSSSKNEERPEIEIVQEYSNNPFSSENQEKFSLITKPFELQIKQQQDRIERLLDRVESLQDEKIKLKEELQLKIVDLTAQNKFYDLQLSAYKEKLEKIENKKWWKFWQIKKSSQ